MVFHFYNTFLNLLNISFIFSGRIIISSTDSCFSILTSFDLVTVSAILFPINSPALWNTVLEAVFKESRPVSDICSLYFLQMLKIHIL